MAFWEYSVGGEGIHMEKVGRKVFGGTYWTYVCNKIFYTYFVYLGHSVLISDSHQNILPVNTLDFSGPRMVNSK